VSVAKVAPFVRALSKVGVPFGVYANTVGRDTTSPERYATAAAEWIEEGATIIGGCCGTGPAHVRALAGLLA
jgi:S-methylmethionine-dependent homocysteine/selenocysteine methylase